MYWIHTYWTNSYEPVFKKVIEPGLGVISITERHKKDLIDFLIFIKSELSENIFKKLIKELSELYNYKKLEICKLIEIVFRLKNKLSKDKDYFVSFDLIYHKLK